MTHDEFEIPPKRERERPERILFSVSFDYTTVKIDIENMHSEGVQASLIQARVDGFLRMYDGAKLTRATLAEIKATLDSWSYRLRETGFVAAEYVGEGRWRWEGAVLR